MIGRNFQFVIVQFCCLLIFTALAIADDVPTVKDFAFSRSIEVSGNNGFNMFDVPEDVYHSVTSSNLGDTRIFNGAGAVVRSEVSVPESENITSLEEINLSLFPIEGADSEKDGGSSVQVSEDSSGKIVSVRFEGASKQKNAKSSRIEYLADLRSLNNPIGKFEVSWKGSEGHLVPVEVSSSDNLKSWRSYCSGVLANLQYQGHEVKETRLDCPELKTKFIRFSFPRDSNLALESIRTQVQRIETTLPKESSVLLTALGTGQGGTVFLYDSKALLPAHEVVLHFPDRNVLIDVAISSRAAIEAPFEERERFNAYSLTIDGVAIQNGSRSLRRVVSDRYWKVETKDKEIKLSGPPTLELRWRQHRIYFLTHGDPPFTFAYGSALVSRNSQTANDVRSLMRASNTSPGNATLGEAQEAGGTSLLEALPAPTQWRKWVLWGVLGIVLSMVLIMALRLSRELKE